MKEILLHTVMHTGGMFCRALLASSYTSLKSVRKTYNDYQHNISKHTNTNQALAGLVVVTTTVGDKCRFIASHHVVPDQPIYNMIKNNSCNTPVVTTLRDPLLAMNTVMWRSIYNKTYPIQIIKWRRLQEAKRQVAVIKECLELNKLGKTFLLPVDLKEIDVACDMFKYCNLNLTKKVRESIAAWKPTNITQRINTQSQDSKKFHKIIKNGIKAKSKSVVRQHLGIEFEYLRKQDDLKKQLEDIGYKDLLWF